MSYLEVRGLDYVYPDGTKALHGVNLTIEAGEIVREAIGTLGDRQRMAVLLSKFEDMSYADIAEAMELSVQATKSLLSRARGKLKVVLEPYLNQGVSPQTGFAETQELSAGQPESTENDV